MLRVLDDLYQLARLVALRAKVCILHELVALLHQRLDRNEPFVSVVRIFEDASLPEVLAQRGGPRSIPFRVRAFDSTFCRYEARFLRFNNGLVDVPLRLLEDIAKLLIRRAGANSLPKLHQSTAFLVVHFSISAVLLDSRVIARAVRILAYRIFALDFEIIALVTYLL